MSELIDRFSNFVKGCITGFDRIAFNFKNVRKILVFS
jgi:hypothetical protein